MLEAESSNTIGYSDALQIPCDAFRSGSKRACDIVLSSIAILLLIPLFVIISVLLKLYDPGPVIYRHKRVGYNGRMFQCFKFRTMRVDSQEILDALLRSDPEASAEWNETRKLKNDPRITALGRCLRQASLDEIPQFVNVLKGEMSLVGPRPIVASELALYGDASRYYLSVRPGITGLWQISGRSNCSYDERVRMDSHYVRNWSLSNDLFIALQTFFVVFDRKGSW